MAKGNARDISSYQISLCNRKLCFFFFFFIIIITLNKAIYKTLIFREKNANR